MQAPLVTAVIPTRNRPTYVLHAVNSVLCQTYTNVQVVVVIDGVDEETERILSKLDDMRVRVIAHHETVGGAEARNLGARAAEGTYIAFLDDDDEWLPNKIQLQVNAALQTVNRHPLLSCQVIARAGGKDRIWPLKPPVEPLSDYLMVRNQLGYGEGLMQTSTLMVPRELFNLVPFTKGLAKHQDWDWVLRCAAREDVCLVFLEMPLVVWNLDSGTTRVSRSNRWKDSLNWIRGISELATRRSYAAFISHYVAPQASRDGAYSRFFPLLAEMYRKGSPRLRDIVVYVAVWMLPNRLLITLRAVAKR